MRTFTLEDGQIVPGFPAQQGPTQWYMDGITLNQDCLPEIVNGRVVTASFSKPHYPAVDRPANLSESTWQQWLRETPSVGRSTQPVYTLRREKNPNDKAVLVMFEGSFRTEEGAAWPTAHRIKDWRSHEIKTSIVRMVPGMRLLLDNGRSCLVYQCGADHPEYFTWRQWELLQAETLANPINARCVTLEQTRIRGYSGLQQRCLSGISVDADTPLGAAIRLGDAEHPEWLPLFSEGCQAVLQTVSIGLIAERRLQEYRYQHAPVDRELKFRSVPLYGLTPISESDGTSYLVRIEGTYFHDSKTLRGEPVFIRWQDDERYEHWPLQDTGAVAFVLKEGEAIGYRSRSRSQYDETTEPDFVLDVRDNELRVTAYPEWQTADMNERPEEYLSAKWNPQATLPNIPSSWVGQQVTLNWNRISGELMGVDGDAVLLRQDWSSGQPPQVKRYEALWVKRGGMSIRRRSVDSQRQTFLKTRINHAVFEDTTTMTDLLATTNRQYKIRPVVIVELGVCEKTGEVAVMYGAPTLEKGWGNRSWNVETKWCTTHREAQQLRQAFIERINHSTDESEVDALKRRLAYEREFPSRLVW